MTSTKIGVPVCAADEFVEEEAQIVDVPGIGDVAVYEVDGAYYGIADRCSHQSAHLSDGFLEGCAVECPLHTSAFSLLTGEPDGPPAKIAVPVFEAWEVDGMVFVSPTPRITTRAEGPAA